MDGSRYMQGIADKRPDMHCLGMNEGNVPLQPHYQKLIMKAGNELEHNRLLKQMLNEWGPAGSGYAIPEGARAFLPAATARRITEGKFNRTWRDRTLP